MPVTGLSGVVAIAAGAEHSLALLNNGTVMAWGNNEQGELGNGTTTNTAVPVAVTGLSHVVAIAAGGYHSLALLENGTVMAWGENEYGQLGNGSSTAPECGPPGEQEICSATPVEVKGLSETKGIAAGFQHSLSYGPVPPVPALIRQGLSLRKASESRKRRSMCRSNRARAATDGKRARHPARPFQLVLGSPAARGRCRT